MRMKKIIRLVVTFVFVFCCAILKTSNDKLYQTDAKKYLYKNGDVFNFIYTGNVQAFTAPIRGYYTLELWGAQGGSHNGGTGGKGAYTKGTIELKMGETVYIYVGGKGSDSTTTTGGYNGGAYKSSTWVSGAGASGGGATDVRLKDGLWSDTASLTSRIMVAAGGGGSEGYNGAPGGALTGYGWYNGTLTTTGAASQTSGGSGKYGAGSFGKGVTNAYTAGAGGGYYGGSSSTFSLNYNSNVATESGTASFTAIKHVKYGAGSNNAYGYYNKSVACTNDVFGDPYNGTVKACYVTTSEIYAGSSGSSYISGHNGSIAVKGENDTTAVATTSTSIADSYHYSGKIFTETQMIAGNATMTNPEDNTSIIGRAGNGYARITLKQITSNDATLKSLTLNDGEIDIDFSKEVTEYVIDLPENMTKVKIEAVQNDLDAAISEGSLGEFIIMPEGYKRSITVTAPSGDVKIYDLYFNRPKSTYKYLDDIKYNGISLEGFNPTKTSYEIHLPYYIEENITLTVDKARPTQVVVGTGDFTIDRTMTSLISVTSETGLEYTTYMITFIIDDSSLLKTLNIGNTSLIPIFNSETFNYKINLDENPQNYTIEALAYDKDALVNIEGSLVSKDNYLKITVTEPNSVTSVYTVRTTGGIDTTYTEDSCKEWTVPVSGTYKLQVWGAEGGGSRLSGNSGSGLGGKGGYARGTVSLTKGTILYICTGSAGTSNIKGIAKGGFNGGGDAYGTGAEEPGNGGGGATDIRIGSNNLLNRVIVAGGGGGGGEDPGDSYGHGGGTTGANGTGINSYNATQTEAGLNGSLGIGASTGVGDGGAGGGGFYGGGTESSQVQGTDTSGGGGGSGFVFTDTATLPAGYALDSKYHLKDAVTIAGNQSMPNYDGTDTIIGNLSNGYAKIDLLYVNSNDARLKNIQISPKNIIETFDKNTYEYSVNLDADEYLVNIQAEAYDKYATVVNSTIGEFETTASNSTHEIMIVAEDGTTSIYTINFYRAKSAYRYLSGIKINGVAIDDFEPTKSNYTIELPYNYEGTVHVEGIKGRLSQTVINEGDIDFLSQNYSHMLGVVSEDDSKSFAYNLTFHTADSTKLKNLIVGTDNEYAVTDFNPNTFEYSIIVPKNVVSLPIGYVTYDKDATVKISGNGYIKTTGTSIKVTVTEPNTQPTIYTINVTRETSSSGGTVYQTNNYTCSNSIQEFTAPITADYKIELWGAQGGSHNGGTGGKGAYTKGTIRLNKGETIYINVGCKGSNSTTTSGGYNGGGYKTSTWVSGAGASGGGATDIRLTNSATAFTSRIMVASGGGGSEGYNGAPGGALTGYGWYRGSLTTTNAASQTSGGTGNYGAGSFGKGNSNAYTAGAGGGYYGGSSSTFSLDYGSRVAGESGTASFTAIKHVKYGAGGGNAYGYKNNSVGCNNGVFGDPNVGIVKACYVTNSEIYAGSSGSSYISGYNGSIAVKGENDSSPIVTTSTSVTDSYHYSGKVFKDTQMIAGNAIMPDPNGSQMTGNSGDGKASIAMLYEASNDNILKQIIISKGTLEPEYNYDTTEYKLYLDENDREITISGVAFDPLASVSGNGVYKTEDTETIIDLVVTAENGDVRNYKIKALRGVSDDPSLIDIQISGLVQSVCSLNATYCNYAGLVDDQTTYDITVPTKIEQISIQAVKRNNAQIVAGLGPKTLSSGLNTYNIISIAEDGVTQITYTFNITRELGGQSNLLDLNVVSPNVDLEFQKNTLDYRISIPYEYENVVFDYIPCDEYVTVEIIGNTNLEVGENIVDIVVTAQNGSKTTYKVYVWRESSSNTFLTNLDIYDMSIDTTNMDAFTLTPGFSKNIMSYSLEVESNVTDIYVDAISDDFDSIVEGTGDYTLNAGINVIDITVTSVDGEVLIYTVNINKARSTNAYLEDLIVNNGTLNEEFESELLNYTVNVANDVNSLDLTIIPTSVTSTYRIIGNSNFKSGNNLVRIIVTSESKAQKIYKLVVTKSGSTNNDLKSLTTNIGELNEEFNKDLLEYTIDVPYETTKIEVSAEASDSHSIVDGTGSYALVVGNNDIYIDVTSEDDSTKTYHLTVNRIADGNNNLLQIDFDNSSTLVPVFDKDITDYTLNVQNEIDEITIIAVPESNNSTVDGNGIYQLITGENIIEITVTAQNYEEKTYTIKVVRDKSIEDDLTFLLVEEGALSPTFEPTVINYTVKVNNLVENIHIRAITEDPNASYQIIGGNNLVVGNNDVIVRVISEMGVPYVKDYNINVIRQEIGSGYELEKINISNGSLSPTFDSDQYVYDVIVPYEVETFRVEAIALDKENTIISGTCFSDNSINKNNGNCPLNIGKNVIVIHTLSSENQIEQTYQIIVSRSKSSDASIKQMLLNNSILSPGFDSDILEYTTSTFNESIDFNTITLNEEEATYQVLNNNNFTIGENEVTIRVTAPDGITIKDYKIIVTKEASNNNNLKSLEVIDFTYTPQFDKNTTVYNLTVPRETNSINLSMEPEDDSSTVVVDGGLLQTLDIGRNIIEIVVSSESGNKKTYRLIVTREGSTNNKLASLSINEGILSPEFDPDVNSYSVNVAGTVEQINIDATLSDSSATISFNNTYDLTELTTEIPIIVTSENGVTNTYTITVHKESIKSAKLKNIKLNHYTLSPSFNSDIDNYLVMVDNEITSLNFTEIITEDESATYEVLNNQNFIVGINTVTIRVTSSDLANTNDYIINVNRQMTSNNFLDYIDISIGTLTPNYSKTEMEYNINVPIGNNSIIIRGVAEDENSVVLGNGEYNLNPGMNEVKLRVISQLGISRTYNIHIFREVSTNNLLDDLIVRDGRTNIELSPEFNPSTNNYTIELTSDIERINILPTINDETATISGDTGEVSIVPLENVFEIVVTSEAGTINTYRITANRPLSDNNYLTNLIPSIGEMSPEFDYFETEYTITVPSTANTLSFEAYTENKYATVSGALEEYISQGESTRTITITAENGAERNITVKIIKQRDDDASLKSLSIANYTLTPEFSSANGVYMLTVPYEKTMLLQGDIEAIANDSRAIITKMTSLSLSTSYINSYIINVLAADGFTTQNYVILVTRQKGSDASLSNLRVNNATLEPTFNSETLEYTIKVDKTATLFSGADVYATANDSEATIVKTDFVDLTEENKVLNIVVTSGDGTQTKTYKINIEFALSNDARLATLTANNGTFDKEFDKDTYEYTLSMIGANNKVTFNATPYEKDATVESGLDEITIDTLSKTHNITVTAEDGTTNIYVINIIRYFGSNANLSNISVTNGYLDKAFNERTYDYTLYVPKGTTTIESTSIVPTLSDPYASYEMNESIDLSENMKWEIVVTSSNNEVENTYTLNIEYDLSRNNYLKELNINPGTFNSTFNKETTSYNISVMDVQTYINIEAIVEDETAEIVSGIGRIELPTNTTSHKIKVKAENGDILEYTLNITKDITTQKYLESVIFEGFDSNCGEDLCKLNPTFIGETLNYIMTVPSSVSLLTLDITKRNANQQIELINGLDNSPVDPRGYGLVNGRNELKIKVTNGLGEETYYTFVITKLRSSNTNLASLSLTNPNYTFTNFSSGVTEYSMDLDNQYTEVQISATCEDSTKASYTVLNNTNLVPGRNEVIVRVTAEDGSSKDYIIHIFRKNTYDNLLSSLVVKNESGDPLNLSPTFDKGTYSYQVQIDSNTDYVTVEATPNDITTTVTGTGKFECVGGANKINVVSKASNGQEITYTVNVIKEKSNDANLSKLEVTGYNLNPVFNKNTTEYNITVDSNVSQLDLDLETENKNAKYIISGNANFITGNNIVKIIVTAEDDWTQKIYIINVNKQSLSNNLLENITINNGTLNPSFDPSINSYTVSVLSNISSIEINAKRQDLLSTLIGDGKYSLKFGENTISLVVTAENGDINTYQIVVTRQYDRRLKSLTISNVTFDFDIDTYEYNIDIPSTIKSVKIEGIAKENTSTVIGNNTYDLSSGQNTITITSKDPDNVLTNYVININKAYKTDASLKSLLVNEGALDPNFNSNITSYNIIVPNEITSLNIDAIANDVNATIEITGNRNFKIGTNTVTIEVTAEDNTTTKEYNLIVERQNIALYSNKLTAITVDKGSLTPIFDKDTNFYQVNVANSDTNITIAALREDVESQITGVGTHLLSVGINNIPIVVTSKDDVMRTYMIQVNRAFSSEARIKSLTIDNQTLTPLFDRNIFEYQLNLDSDTMINPIIELLDKDATYEISGNENLLAGNNDVIIKTLASDKVTQKTYTIHVNRLASHNNNLASLTTSLGNLSPEFTNTNAGPYIITVASDKNTIEILASTEDDRASIIGTGIYELKNRNTDISVCVTSESGNVKTYVIRVQKEYSDDSSLKLLTLNEGIITPTFDPEVLNYTVNVDYETTNVLLTALPNNQNAEVLGSGEKSLNVGENTFLIIVNAQNGDSTTYKVVVTREDSETIEYSSKLSNIKIEEGEISPNFNKSIGGYAISVPNEVTSLTLDITTEDPLATYEILGNQDFMIGENNISIIVTAQDNTTTVYTISASRQVASNNMLESLYVDYGVLSPEFNKNQLLYTIDVPSSLNEIEIFAKAIDANATISGTGKKQLISGENNFYIKVTSSSGIERTYTIVVNKAYSTDNKLNSLTTSIGTLNPLFNPNTNDYTIDVPIGTSQIVLNATANELATITGIGTINISKGENIINIDVTAEDGSTNTYQITVNRPLDTNKNISSITPSVGTLNESETYDYEMEVNDATALISFEVETESSLATVSGNKNISLSYGENIIPITIKAEDESEKVIQISVTRNIDLLDITLSKTELNMKPNDVEEVIVSFSPINATFKDVIFESLNENVVTVSNGIITAIAPGTTTIKVSSVQNPLIYKIINVNVQTFEISSDIYTVVRDELEYIIGIEPTTRLEDFINNLNNESSTIKIYTKDNIEITDVDSYIGTEAIVKLVINDIVYDELSIVVKGDINGDGIIDVVDVSQTEACILSKSVLNALQIVSADIDNSNFLDVVDTNGIKSYILSKLDSLN